MIDDVSTGGKIKSLSARRAWIEIRLVAPSAAAPSSLSARRAWIEIWFALKISLSSAVALRKESVDRNSRERPNGLLLVASLSARRAWIEIYE